MFNHSHSSLLLAALTCCATAMGTAHAQSQTAKPVTQLSANSDPRDFQGIWQGPPLNHDFTAGFAAPPTDGSGPPIALGAGATNLLPLKPEVAAKAEHQMKMMLAGTTLMSWHVACRPGPAQGLLSDDLGAFEVIQTPSRVLFLFDTSNTYWEVYLDRDHPKNPKPSYLGHSVGHWEGDVLVVDTVGYNGRGSVIMGAIPSQQLHTITRFWKEAGGKQIKYETYIEDPVNLTKPAKLPVAVVNWTPDHRIYEEHCTQNTRPENFTDMVFEDFTREEAFPYFYKKK